MLEWLRLWIFKPLMELVLLCPLPWRYAVLLFVPLALIYALSPVGFAHRLVMWCAVGISRLIASLSEALQSLCAGRPASTVIDAVDNGTEWAFRRSRLVAQGARARTAFPLQWGRPRLWLIALIVLAPVMAWYARPGLGNISVSRGIDAGFGQFHALESWALTSAWVADSALASESQKVIEATPAKEKPLLAPTALAQPISAANMEEPAAIKIGDTVYIVHTEGKGLRVRSAPASNSSVITKFAEGSTVQIIDGPKDADGYIWWKVKGKADEGWCAADFLSLTQ